MSDINNNSMLSSSASHQPLTSRNPASETAPRVGAKSRKSYFEDRFVQFDADLIDAAIKAKTSAAPYLHNLNRVANICAGLGSVMRIVAGNPCVESFYDPTDPDSEPPLGAVTIGNLVTMTAELLEMLNNDISKSAMELSLAVKA